MAELLRLATAGSVDDGKSTLIGRLLYDSKQVFEDQLRAVEVASTARGDEYTDLALLTDGLRAEREQGITIDVAYRPFATKKRRFVIADTPGHTQHTRNMVTGISTADLVVVLVDVRAGATEQSRRHATLASIMRVSHMVVCVNKMDLVSWDELAFEQVKQEFIDFSAKLEVPDISFIPISALLGDNVTQRSPNMPWYEGLSLLNYLEELHIASDRNLIDVRFPVQRVVRPVTSEHTGYRGYAGEVAGGVLEPGDDVIVLPSGLSSTIASIDTIDGPLEAAFPPMSVTLRLADDLDVSRGDMICRPHNQPAAGQDVQAMVCWMSRDAMRTGAMFAIKHTTRSARALVKKLHYRLDVNSLHRDRSTDSLELNDVGRVELRTTSPLFFDSYARNRLTGSFILMDEATNSTVGAGMIVDRSS
ncbi:MAG: GTP-binding protein [Actinomycetota bacterium]|jgi:bifunctional enzyme CysN/CysC|nr:GTP-binding protein [Actinomycetota bacterium]